MRKPKSSDDVSRPRSGNRSTSVFLTGGTGFLGSHLAAELLRRGNKVMILVRPSNGTNPSKRIKKLMDWHGVDDDLRHRLHIVKGDILLPGMGISSNVRRQLRGRIGEILHCASATSFAERKRQEIEEINLRGLIHLLNFAEEGGCSSFQLVSTAYVSGRRQGICREEFTPVDEFNNAYEETKWKAERFALERCNELGIPINIFRPSVVCGNSKSGRSLNFNGIYHPIRSAVFLRDLYLRDIKDKGGRRAALAGVRLGSNGIVHLPLRVGIDSGTGIDIIPVDHFVDAFFALRDDSTNGGIFHIARGWLTPVLEIIDFSRRFFKIAGINAVESRTLVDEPRNPIETLFDGLISVYSPYMSDSRIFAMDISRPILEKNGIVSPKFDFDVFSRCMAYAVKTRWGAELFS